MTQAVLFMAIVPIALAMVLALVLFGDRLKPERRTRVERIMAAILYPLITVYWLWRAADLAGDGAVVAAAAMLMVAALFGWIGVQALRTGRLAPYARRVS